MSERRRIARRVRVVAIPAAFLVLVGSWALPTEPPDWMPQPAAVRPLAPGGEAESAGLARPLAGGIRLEPRPAPAVASSEVKVRRVARAEAQNPAPDRGARQIPEPGGVILPTVDAPAVSRPPGVDPRAPVGSRAPSPGFAGGYAGLDDIPDVVSGYRSIPPDTDGAVGLTKVVEALNNNYRFRDKTTGATLATVSPEGFWSGVGGTNFFDPRVLYDPYNDRWLMVSVSDPAVANSSVEIGVSQSGDPQGSWWTWRIDANSANTQWADFPTVGFNKNWVAINVNMFRNSNNAYVSSKVLVVDYPSLRTGAYAGSFLTGTDFTMAPAITYSTTENTLYMPAHYTHFVGGNGAYRVWELTGTPAAPVLSSPACCLNRGVAWGAPSLAPQAAPLSGASSCGATPCPIETNDERIGSAPVFRNGSLYYAQTVGLPYGGVTHTGVLWTKLTAATGAVADGGFIHDATATASNGGKWYSFPAIAVNADEDVLVAYSQLSSAQYASAGYSIHLSTDAAGVMREPVVYKTGEDYYNKTFGGPDNRWGDYSDAQVDPSDDTTFWGLQEYAKARVGTDDGATGTNSSRWGTWWVKVNPHLPAVMWDPSAGGTRVAQRPRTCNTPSGTCTDSGRSWTSAAASVASSNNGSTHYVHAVWTTDGPTGDEGNGAVPHGADCATTTNPATGSAPYCSGVAYARSADAGVTWTGAGVSAPVMVSPGATHAGRPAIATSGQYVHVAYVTTTGYADQMCADDARVLWVVTNSNYGAAGAWGAPVRLSSLTGRVDRPSIAASGSTVSVVHTDAATGDVVLDRSTNDGASFATQTIGHTDATHDNGVSPGSPLCATAPTPSGLEGFSGRAVIAGAGATVGAAWIRNPTGRAIAKISTDGGASWPGGGEGSPCTGGVGPCSLHLSSAGALGAGGRSSVSAAASSGRVAFAWVDDSGIAMPKGLYVRVFTATGGWGPPRLVSCMQTGGSCAGAPAAALYDSGYSPSIATYGSTGLGVAWSGCPYMPTDPAVPCDRSMADPGAEILWKESWDDGTTWSAGEGPTSSYRRIVADTGPSSAVNDGVSVTMDATTGVGSGCAQQAASLPVGIPALGCKRYVLYTGQTASASVSRLYLSIGTQIPAP